jgi:hypothetical protein
MSCWPSKNVLTENGIRNKNFEKFSEKIHVNVFEVWSNLFFSSYGKGTRRVKSVLMVQKMLMLITLIITVEASKCVAFFAESNRL